MNLYLSVCIYVCMLKDNAKNHLKRNKGQSRMSGVDKKYLEFKILFFFSLKGIEKTFLPFTVIS